jgi:hypothetical protein
VVSEKKEQMQVVSIKLVCVVSNELFKGLMDPVLYLYLSMDIDIFSLVSLSS